eukprot:1183114-Prorocentrum_minimum.AAC.2
MVNALHLAAQFVAGPPYICIVTFVSYLQQAGQRMRRDDMWCRVTFASHLQQAGQRMLRGDMWCRVTFASHHARLVSRLVSGFAIMGCHVHDDAEPLTTDPQERGGLVKMQCYPSSGNQDLPPPSCACSE